MTNRVVDLIRDGAELQLFRHSGDGVFGSVNRILVDDVDERYVTFRPCGLDTSHRPCRPDLGPPRVRRRRPRRQHALLLPAKHKQYQVVNC